MPGSMNCFDGPFLEAEPPRLLDFVFLHSDVNAVGEPLVRPVQDDAHAEFLDPEDRPQGNEVGGAYFHLPIDHFAAYHS